MRQFYDKNSVMKFSMTSEQLKQVIGCQFSAPNRSCKNIKRGAKCPYFRLCSSYAHKVSLVDGEGDFGKEAVQMFKKNVLEESD